MTPRTIARAVGGLLLVALVAFVVDRSLSGSDPDAEGDRMDRQRVQVALDYRRARARVDTVSRDVIRYATRWDTAYATVNVHDTVQVERALATADTTIHACRLLVTTCHDALAHADTLRALDAARFRLALAAERSRGRRRLLVWLPAAAVAGALLLHVGVRGCTSSTSNV